MFIVFRDYLAEKIIWESESDDGSHLYSLPQVKSKISQPYWAAQPQNRISRNKEHLFFINALSVPKLVETLKTMHSSFKMARTNQNERFYKSALTTLHL